eukprot:TRINITY_DN2382_c0_g1_i10.p1 TRINITY_DN2382_c0_g1~~TRINITY_DN2382_c0_g1_i10.p1  ORF type:complete len:961 (-),score=39.79 TRINITY_DN2382_c0_g1_i10:2808-5447(-)
MMYTSGQLKVIMADNSGMWLMDSATQATNFNSSGNLSGAGTLNLHVAYLSGAVSVTSVHAITIFFTTGHATGAVETEQCTFSSGLFTTRSLLCSTADILQGATWCSTENTTILHVLETNGFWSNNGTAILSTLHEIHNNGEITNNGFMQLNGTPSCKISNNGEIINNGFITINGSAEIQGDLRNSGTLEVYGIFISHHGSNFKTANFFGVATMFNWTFGKQSVVTTQNTSIHLGGNLKLAGLFFAPVDIQNATVEIETVSFFSPLHITHSLVQGETIILNTLTLISNSQLYTKLQNLFVVEFHNVRLMAMVENTENATAVFSQTVDGAGLFFSNGTFIIETADFYIPTLTTSGEIVIYGHATLHTTCNFSTTHIVLNSGAIMDIHSDTTVHNCSVTGKGNFSVTENKCSVFETTFDVPVVISGGTFWLLSNTSLTQHLYWENGTVQANPGISLIVYKTYLSNGKHIMNATIENHGVFEWISGNVAGTSSMTNFANVSFSCNGCVWQPTLNNQAIFIINHNTTIFTLFNTHVVTVHGNLHVYVYNSTALTNLTKSAQMTILDMLFLSEYSSLIGVGTMSVMKHAEMAGESQVKLQIYAARSVFKNFVNKGKLTWQFGNITGTIINEDTFIASTITNKHTCYFCSLVVTPDSHLALQTEINFIHGQLLIEKNAAVTLEASLTCTECDQSFIVNQGHCIVTKPSTIPVVVSNIGEFAIFSEVHSHYFFSNGTVILNNNTLYSSVSAFYQNSTTKNGTLVLVEQAIMNGDFECNVRIEGQVAITNSATAFHLLLEKPGILQGPGILQATSVELNGTLKNVQIGAELCQAQDFVMSNATLMFVTGIFNGSIFGSNSFIVNLKLCAFFTTSNSFCLFQQHTNSKH